MPRRESVSSPSTTTSLLVVTVGVTALVLGIAWQTQTFVYGCVCMGLQLAGYIPASLLRTERHYDATGSVTFLVLLAMSFAGIESALHWRQAAVVAAVTCWTLRLGGYLVWRMALDGKDSRFDKARNTPALLAMFWSMQGLWVFLCIHPVLLLNARERLPASADEISRLDVLGLVLWLGGMVLEAVADAQKFRFKQAERRAGRKPTFIAEGVWMWCRHPNYLGEVVLWMGLYLCCMPALLDREGRPWNTDAVIEALLLPASPGMVLFIVAYVAVNMVESAAERRFGPSDPKWRKYNAAVPCLVPGFG